MKLNKLATGIILSVLTTATAVSLGLTKDSQTNVALADNFCQLEYYETRQGKSMVRCTGECPSGECILQYRKKNSEEPWKNNTDDNARLHDPDREVSSSEEYRAFCN